MDSFYSSMDGLLNHLKEKGYLKSEKVYQSMKKTDRKDFAPNNPYFDSPQPIGYNATISAPHMHAFALEYLAPYIHPGSKVLDVGYGSGYLVVAFSKLMDDNGTVVGIEHIHELCELGRRNVQKSHNDLLQSRKVILVEGDGRNGYAAEGPYNCIHVGAAAPEIPKALVDQLAPGGRLFIPVGVYNQSIVLVDKDLNGNISKQDVLDVRYVPLTSKENQLRGY